MSPRYVLAIFASLVLPSVGLGAEPPNVAAIRASYQEIFDTYIYPVSLASRRDSKVHSEILGVIKDIRVEIGQKVKEGDQLLLIQHTQPEYSQIPIWIKSPIAGTIAAIARKVGSRVQQGEFLVHVIDRYDLEMSVEIPETELSLLAKGVEGEMSFRQIAVPIPVQIDGISPLVNPVSGTAQGKLSVRSKAASDSLRDQIKHRLYPGMIGQAKFTVNFRKAIAIPKEAVTIEKQKHLVRTVIDGKVVKKDVTMGKEMKGLVEIEAGLSEGDLVITSRSKYLKEGEDVKVDEPKVPNE